MKLALSIYNVTFTGRRISIHSFVQKANLTLLLDILQSKSLTMDNRDC